MKERFKFYLSCVLFWYTCFFSFRLLFVLFNLDQVLGLKSLKETCLIFIYGLKLDTSAIGYISVLLVLVTALSSFFKRPVLYYFSLLYTAALLLACVLVTVIDLRLYPHWGFRLDISPLAYFKTPGEALASVSFSDYLVLFISLPLLFYPLWRLFRKYCLSLIISLKPDYFKSPAAFLLLAPLLFLPIRGSVGLAPIQVGSAYFSNNYFANHAAINVPWCIGDSAVNAANFKSRHSFMPRAKVRQIFNKLYGRGDSKTRLLKEGAAPSLLFIVLESFSSKFINKTVKGREVTPNLNRYARAGIYFNNIYASGNRSDKGLAGIFSGYPSHTRFSIMRNPKKGNSLPSLIRPFMENGYRTALYYGGDIDFVNFRSFFLQSGVQELVVREDFPRRTYGRKWGVYDQFVFAYALTNIIKTSGPFLHILYTLTSHEPFDIPETYTFGRKSKTRRFLSSIRYTDKHLGIFLEELKKKPLWQNLLVVLVADHSHRMPGKTPYYSGPTFKIPLVWLGGALKTRRKTVTAFGSQTDIPRTLLNQFGLPAAPFKFSRDLLSDPGKSFAYYGFKNGFAFLTEKNGVAYSTKRKRILTHYGTETNTMLMNGKAYLMMLEDDFQKR